MVEEKAEGATNQLAEPPPAATVSLVVLEEVEAAEASAVGEVAVAARQMALQLAQSPEQSAPCETSLWRSQFDIERSRCQARSVAGAGVRRGGGQKVHAHSCFDTRARASHSFCNCN